MSKNKFTRQERNEIIQFAKQHGDFAAAKKFEPSITTIKRWVAESNKAEEVADSIKVSVLEKRIAFLEEKQQELVKIIDDSDFAIDALRIDNRTLETKLKGESIFAKLKKLFCTANVPRGTKNKKI